MRRLATLCAAVSLVVLTATLLQPRHWMAEAGTFFAFLGSLAVAATVVVDSLVARRRGKGFLGPGLPTASRTFWTAMAVNTVMGFVILSMDGHGGTDSYAIGAGALLPHALVLLAATACILFATVRWWPLRLLLATVAGCTAAFSCMAATWWL